MSDDAGTDTLARTPLHDEHRALGATLVGFAGYEMPVRYAAGIMAEHTHTRAAAGLFDVSHMGQLRLTGSGAADALERLVPGDIAGLAPWAMRYTQFTDDEGGILDDLIATRTDYGVHLVVNASCKEQDIAHLERRLDAGVGLSVLSERALVALQGPRAAAVLERHAPGCTRLAFMTAGTFAIGGADALVSRCGYTGEDGFEISVPEDAAVALWRCLVAEPEVEPVGLGARDSLRLEAGLCLYGHDIDETTSPVEAGLAWSIGKRRRTGGGFPGAARIQQELAEGPKRRRVGILPDGKAPAREGTPVLDADGEEIGTVTSGGFGPTAGGPVAMGYVAAEAAEIGRPVSLLVRGKPRPAAIVKLPFVPHTYHRP
ncbi:MAG: glycine cleavage system aminomethyltransferase GcvT [Rhodospirillales bacterium]|nr:glycine cleavage system aminomethyltransferase GcvT [Rhodospirillales bacterium]